MPTASRPKNIIYDGECPICQRFKTDAETHIPNPDLRFIAYQNPQFSAQVPGLSPEQASQAVYVILENGQRYRGARAVFEILSQYQGWRGRVGKILIRFPFYRLAEPLYGWLANNRHKFLA